MTLLLSSSKFGDFKTYLEQSGYTFEERPYQKFLAKKSGISINLYDNGKILLAGKNDTEKTKVEEYLNLLQASHVFIPVKEYPMIEVSGIRIGTDESGKGDYFGPLVIGGVCVNESQAKQLKLLGVRDSKELNDIAVDNLAVGIRKILKPTERTLVSVGPNRYNDLHNKMRNVNRILGWGHARAIENLLADNPECKTAVADKFGNESYIKRDLMSKGRNVTLIQTPRGEREITVAAASILARAEFLDRMREMSQSYGMEFPKGATDVIQMAEKFVLSNSGRALLNVAKVDFVTTKKIPNLPQLDPQCFRRNPTVHVKYGHGKQYVNYDGLGAVRTGSTEIKNCREARKASGDDSSLGKRYSGTRFNAFSGKP